MESSIPKQLSALTSLRFLAALYVFLVHFVLFSCNKQCLSDLNSFADLFKEGHIGVSFFFVLSGFILSHSYGNRLKTKAISWKSFYYSRIARIYPLHLLTLAISIALILPMPIYGYNALIQKFGWGITQIITMLNIGLFQSFVPSSYTFFAFNGLSWSLSAEVFFYLCFPLLILQSSRTLIAICTLLLSLLLFSYKYLDINHITWLQGDRLPPEFFIFYIFPLFRLPDFIIGILAHRYMKKYIDKNSAPSITVSTMLQLFSLALLVFSITQRNNIGFPWRWDLFYIIPMAGVIMSCALENGLVSRLLSQKAFVFLGEISFSFYLLHVLLITLSDQWIQKWLQASSSLQHIATIISTQTSLRIVLYISLCIALSALFYLFYEHPMKKHVYRFLNRKHDSHNDPLKNPLSTHGNTPVAQKTPL